MLKGHETLLRMPLGDYERLTAALPGLKIEDATPIVRRQRMIKSEAEIEKIAHICAVASSAFEEVATFAVPGTPQSEVFREYRRAALAAGADDVPYLVGGAGQGGYRDVIAPPTRRPLQINDILMLDTGCVWDGYYCDFDRNFAIGAAPDLSSKAYDVLWRATEAGRAAAIPGATCRDVYHAMQAVIGELNPDAGDVGRLGHGLGMQLTEWPSIAAFDDTVLEENMVLTLEPSVGYGESLLMVHEENLVVRSAGSELLTARAPADLPVI